MQTLDRMDHQMVWLIGALERLASYGVIQQSPKTLKHEELELFLELDSDYARYNLFKTDKDLIALYDSFVQMYAPVTRDEIRKGIGEFVLEYKNNRYPLVKHCLEQQYKNS